MDKPAAGIFRVGRHAGHAAHGINIALDVHLHGVDDDLRGQPAFMEPAEHICAVQNGRFGVLELIRLPAAAYQIVRGDLECIPQQRVELLKIRVRQLPQGKAIVAVSHLFHKSVLPWQVVCGLPV